MSKDSLKSAIVQIVSDLFHASNVPVTGALLAERLRRAGEDYKDAGYLKLAEPINELVQCGQLSRNRRVKHLEVAPPTYEFDVAAPNTKPSFESYVREDAWPVFALLNSNSIAVYDQEETKFRVLGRDAVIRETQIQVNTPSNDEHRNWIQQFSTEKELSIELKISESATVLKDFSIWMQSQASPLQYEWKGFRASKVAEAIRNWCRENGVDASVFLSRVIPGYAARTTSASSEQSEETVRQAVLKCVSDLTMDDIEDIRLPLRVILKHFKPRG